MGPLLCHGPNSLKGELAVIWDFGYRATISCIERVLTMAHTAGLEWVKSPQRHSLDPSPDRRPCTHKSEVLRRYQ